MVEIWHIDDAIKEACKTTHIFWASSWNKGVYGLVASFQWYKFCYLVDDGISLDCGLVVCLLESGNTPEKVDDVLNVDFLDPELDWLRRWLHG